MPVDCDYKWWRGMDSNHRRRKSTDLQSVAFDRSATPPLKSRARKKNKVFQPDIRDKNLFLRECQ